MAKLEKKKYTGEAYGIAGFVFGVASIMLSIGVNITLLPIAAIIFGIIGLALSIKQQTGKRTGLGMAGIILSIAGIILGILVTWWLVTLIKQVLTEIQKLQSAASGLGAGQLGNLNIG